MIQLVGVRFVAEGAAEYLRTVREANRATGQEMEQATSQGARGLGNLTGSFFKALLGAEAVTRIFDMVVRSAKQLATETLDAYGSYEALSLSIQSLVARELKHADATLGMADAMAQAGPRAEELLNWIQQLAIKSPFDMEGVAVAFKTAQAYGFTANEAQVLTQAMIDFTTATGQGSDVMGRVAYALGQIRNTGKVLTQDLRQLMNAGVDVGYILKQMGYTLEDVKSGIVSSDAFLKQFVTTMQDDFGGAAAASSTTLRGLINTLGDIKKIGLRELFGPAIEAALPYLAAFAEKLQSLMPLVSYFGELIGIATKWLIEHKSAILTTIAAITAGVAAFFLITNAGAIMSAAIATATAIVGGLTAAIGFLLSPIGLVAVAVAGLAALFVFSFSDIQQKTGSFFSDFSGSLFRFGHDLIIALAEGMATALGAVIDVLNSIGQIITYWLSPGSPPKLLPDIDQWGASAINEFMGGFGDADFGIFNSLSNTFSGLIRSMDLGKTDFVPRIQEARNAIAEAISQFNQTGQVGDDSFQAIADAVGLSVDKVKEYANALFNAESANRQLVEAQDALNRVTKEYDDQLAPIDEQLDDIAKQRQAFIDQQRQAELESIISDASSPEEARMLAQLELQEIALRQQRDAIEENKDAAVEEAQTKVDAAAAAAELAEEQLSVQQQLIDAQTESNRLIKEQTEALKSLAGAAGGGGAGGGGAGGVGGGLGGISDAISGIMGGVPSIGGALDGIKDKIRGFLEEIAAPFAGIGEKLEELRETWSTVFIGIGENVDKFMGLMGREWGAGGTWDGIMKNAGTIMQTQWGAGGTWDGIMDNAKLAISLFHDRVKEKMEEVKTAVLDKLTEIRVSVEGKVSEFVQMGKNIIQGLIDGIISKAREAVQAILDTIGAMIDAATSLLEEGSPSQVFVDKGVNVNESLEIGLSKNRGVIEAMGRTISGMIAMPTALPLTYAPPVPQVTNAGVSNMTITGVGQANINNGMDMAQLESLILNTVKRAISK